MLDQRAELTGEHQGIDLPAEVLERYVGLGQIGPHGTVTVTQTEGGLVAEAIGLGMAPIYPARRDRVLREGDPGRAHLRAQPPGAATGVVVRFACGQMRASKVR